MPALHTGLIVLAFAVSWMASIAAAGIQTLDEISTPSIALDTGLALRPRPSAPDAPIFQMSWPMEAVRNDGPLNLEGDLLLRRWQQFYGEAAIPRKLMDFDLLELPRIRESLRSPAPFRPAAVPPPRIEVPIESRLDRGVDAGFRPFVRMKLQKLIRKEYRRARVEPSAPLDDEEDEGSPRLIPPLEFEEPPPSGTIAPNQ